MMIFKKVNIIYIIISLINIAVLIKTLTFTKYASNFCLISDVLSTGEYFSLSSHFEKTKTLLRNEVIDLEKQRESLINDISLKTAELTKLHNEVYQYSMKSFRIRNSIISLTQIRKDFQRRHKNSVDFKPIISKFKNITAEIDFIIYSNKSTLIEIQKCTVFTCFNFEKCAFNQSNSLTMSSRNTINYLDISLKKSMFFSDINPCIMLYFNSSDNAIEECNNNNCVFVLNHTTSIHQHKSVVSSSFFEKNKFRYQYDIVIPNLYPELNILASFLPMIFPLRRRYLLSYTASVNVNLLPKLDKFVLRYLQNISDEIQKETGNNNFYFDVNCIPSKSHLNPLIQDWNLCQNRDSRLKRLTKSKFCLILSHWNINVISTKILQQRLFECLITGSIPVILGDLTLPFEEIIEWKKSVLQFPKQRVMEIVSLIQKIPDSDIFEIKLHNRKILELHFISIQTQIDSIGLVLTKRLGLALPKSSTYQAESLYEKENMTQYNFTLPNFQMEMDPYLGPNNIPSTNSNNFNNNLFRSSPSYFRKSHLDSNFYSYPSTPWDPILPSDNVLRGYSTRGYYGINHSTNEAGTEFMHSLGGNYKYEQFTLVILSFKRHNLLRKSLEMLHGLPYLHSVLVVWNDPSPPPADFKWPKLHVDIKVVKSKRNSLNNRFLPYDLIQTDAVLSFDDDIQLRHDEIIFAFRVWRENRDRIVGFPARYHNEYPGPAKVRYSNNQWWMYNSNYTCEYSMILTGAAFFHRFYLFVYSNEMNPEILNIVDKYKNCEDVAMNFLVSHITRKPPIKVTVRWTFSCVNCDTESGTNDESLHNRPNHYNIRSNCINEFSAIYGYNPLLYSQYRADSVLFKTRLPVDKQKCFRYV